MKFLLNLAILNIVIFVISLFYCSSKAIPASNVDTSALEQQYKTQYEILFNAQLTYRTIVPHHERLSGDNVYQTSYVIFKPEQSIIVKNNYLPMAKIAPKATEKQDITFFQKATLFNDKLQSWLN
jgi:hypothetical protein